MRKLARAMAWFTSGSLIGTVTQIVKGKLSAVLLGPEGMGVLGQLTNAWTLVNSLSGLGFYNGVVRRIAEAHGAGDDNALKTQLSTSLLFLTGFSCFVALLTTTLAPWISALIFDDGGRRAGLVGIMLLSVPFSVTAQTYRGLLSGCQLVRPIVAAQVASDVASVFVYAILLYVYGLVGAVVGFGSVHGLKFLAQLMTIRRALGAGHLLPRFGFFAWSEVRINIGYGFNGLLMGALSIGTALLASRWVIQDLGLHSNGIFTVAWKVGSLYLGALYAAAGSYYFPSLVAAKGDNELARLINEAVNLYLFLLPPLIIVIVIGGDLLIGILFSSEFVAAAVLLGLMLPGDLFRVTAETVGLSFLARRRLISYTLSYCFWAVSFLILTWLLLPRMGVSGIAIAYLISQMFNMFFVIILARRKFGFSFAYDSSRALIVAALAVFLSTLCSMLVSSWWLRYPLGIILLGAWALVSWQDLSFRMLLKAAVAKVSK